MPSNPTIITWVDGTPTDRPLEVGEDVRVKSYGLGARLEDVGRVGTVAAFGRTRVLVEFSPTEARRIDPACLRLP